jgi:hypothetical protein
MQKRYAIALAILAIFAVFFAGFAVANMIVTKELPSSVTVSPVVSLTLYDTETSTVELTSLSWGSILPTESKTQDIWIQNDADLAMNISVTLKNCPENVTFTYVEGKRWGGFFPVLQPHLRASIWLTLSAGTNPSFATFSFTIVVLGVVGN